ncbi:hypothetical protein I601_0530 [Nocardioides dokdonensis FR1436]|uniref:LytR/CpsA/Psr regulator C-terminal domain-containing protein n=1 Tax=Nocardioides dokdonensis FR1436 TaxID=1300347 RepID=A0A1A9GH68_9ACTN|nr:LytR C-terminal domain-containing protein [Nocardioides dokdonensis]ANH36982.1 hypothetical protein I601_0530 [Nocardioides dokdonensis FR1436]
MRARTERGTVLPSPVVILSIVAVAMAAFAFVATQGSEPTEREITPAARESVEDTTSPAAETKPPKPKPTKKPAPAIKRGQVYVEVYNNSSITGLAGRAAQRVTGAGWQVVGEDNWYGTVPATTVYYPPKLERAAELLALDLGIDRTLEATGAMKLDRLTLILTGELD